ncbi:hypothetical protein F4823DRAFT_568692 [Ustulina deusta]|nr:hypothetical protein F4823DRAFT_568692 [Ustulina deusta]
MLLVHGTFFRYAQERGPNITAFISTLAMNAVSKSYIAANRGEDPSGDPMGINASLAPYFCCEETLSWSLESDTAVIEQLSQAIDSELQRKLGNIIVPFLYRNNAGGDQEVFQGYNHTNLARLISIRKKYDPEGMYATQLVGGFKLPA